MTDERFKNEGDTRVTRAYRDLGDESPPAHLDDAILRHARQASRPRYAKLRLWTRPVAWAATVGLSLVIVLQLNDGVLQPDEETVPASAAPAEAARKSLESRSDNAPAVGRAGTMEQKRQEAALPSSAQEIVPANVDLMKEAEDMARMRSGEQQRPDVAAVSTAAFSADLAEEAAAQYCDDEARATPDAWLDCIAALEDRGLENEASFERAAFDEQYADR